MSFTKGHLSVVDANSIDIIESKSGEPQKLVDVPGEKSLRQELDELLSENDKKAEKRVEYLKGWFTNLFKELSKEGIRSLDRFQDLQQVKEDKVLTVHWFWGVYKIHPALKKMQKEFKANGIKSKIWIDGTTIQFKFNW